MDEANTGNDKSNSIDVPIMDQTYRDTDRYK
jgi:hypothetical protein